MVIACLCSRRGRHILASLCRPRSSDSIRMEQYKLIFTCTNRPQCNDEQQLCGTTRDAQSSVHSRYLGLLPSRVPNWSSDGLCRTPFHADHFGVRIFQSSIYLKKSADLTFFNTRDLNYLNNAKCKARFPISTEIHSESILLP